MFWKDCPGLLLMKPITEEIKATFLLCPIWLNMVYAIKETQNVCMLLIGPIKN